VRSLFEQAGPAWSKDAQAVKAWLDAHASEEAR
jgi:hypothetical protein